MSNDLISQGLDGDIAMAHDRFVLAMQQRVPVMPLDSKERYFALISSLVGKLESSDKSMPDILREMMTEATAIIMQELNAPR